MGRWAGALCQCPGGELPQRLLHDGLNQDATDNAFMCELFLLLPHVVVPGNYRVEGIKKDVISPQSSLTVLHLTLTLQPGFLPSQVPL